MIYKYYKLKSTYVNHSMKMV